VKLASQGSIAAIDINPAMVDFASALSAQLTVDWHVASALKLPFENGLFDAVVCQQGVQFFPDPIAGLSEMRRVTKTGGRVGVTMWAPVEQSPFFAAQLHLLRTHCKLPDGVFAQAFPAGGVATLGGWAEQAGWQQVDVQTVERFVQLPHLRAYIPAQLRALPPWAAPFFDLDEPTQQAAINEMLHSLAAFTDSAGDALIPTVSLRMTAANSVA
jgi:SAM-dependent methyltransferase